MKDERKVILLSALKAKKESNLDLEIQSLKARADEIRTKNEIDLSSTQLQAVLKKYSDPNYAAKVRADVRQTDSDSGDEN